MCLFVPFCAVCSSGHQSLTPFFVMNKNAAAAAILAIAVERRAFCVAVPFFILGQQSLAPFFLMVENNRGQN
jgi:hypothetical protein